MGPLVLCIMDGVGMREEREGNAFYQAATPNFDFLWEHYPHSLLEASGVMVGLPEGQMGNSEVGHMNLGAGRIVYQPLELINRSIADKTFFENQELVSIMKEARDNNVKLHLCGLVSDGGIHSHINHLFACLDLAKSLGLKEVFVHAFLDGRDTLPTEAIKYLEELQTYMDQIGIGKLATTGGRYYAMDRDNRWDRIMKYYQVMTTKGIEVMDVKAAIQDSYNRKVTDEFIEPIQINSDGIVRDGDCMICFNFRPDRLRELFSAFTNPSFTGFEREVKPQVRLVTMMPVSDEVVCTNAFSLPVLDHTLGEYLSEKGLSQLRIAETEKYAHVTYFFDGGVEKKLEGEKRILIPSSKVATYDLKPSMSAYEITDALINELVTHTPRVVILNFANGDMVGHTGVFDATVEAVEAMDTCLGKIYQKIQELNGLLVVVADHGNCDYMKDNCGNIVTSHSTSKVPFIVTKKGVSLKDGKLADVAPTILSLLSLEIPSEMTGDVLIK